MVKSASTDKGKRKGAASVSSVPVDILEQLEAGTIESATLSEGLAINFVTLIRNLFPELANKAADTIDPKSGITKRMAAVAQVILRTKGHNAISELTNHPSDTVRGWTAYIIAAQETELPEKLRLIQPLADDPHFGVREWAWLAVRPDIVKSPQEAISLLEPWTKNSSEFIRRFATEATRPRGVWSAHISILKETPEIGLPLLEPLNSDPSRYVQDSVANWLNDAFKSQPDWVESLCSRWEAETKSENTAYIAKRALRSKRAN